MKSLPFIEGWGAGEVEFAGHCPLCDSSIAQPAFQAVSDVEEGVPGAWSFTECGRCRSFYLNPRPSVLALHKAYRSYYTHEIKISENAILASRTLAGRIARGYLTARYGLSARGDEIPAVAALIRPLRLQLDYFMRHLPLSRGTLLDVGCGNGGFMFRAKAVGWDVEGVEPDPKAASAARMQASVPVHESLDALAERKFDVITLSHVIEHVHDPVGLLHRIRDLLVPGGGVWIAAPNARSLGRRIYGRDWQALEVPRHISVPSAEGLLELLRSAGFHSVRLRCRGRGSAKRFEANEQRKSVASPHRAAFASLIVDSLASFIPEAAEELVVEAKLECD